MVLYKSFNGEITKEDLLKHISTDRHRPDEFHIIIQIVLTTIMFWGFSCRIILKKLKDKTYKVKINSTFDNKITLMLLQKIKGFSKRYYNGTHLSSSHS